MKTKDFSFELPPELIAQHPSQKRDDARLLVVRGRASDVSAQDAEDPTGGKSATPPELGAGAQESNGPELEHTRVSQLPRVLPKNSILVFNDTRVRKARVHASVDGLSQKAELLFVGPVTDSRWEAFAKPLRRLKPGRRLELPGGLRAKVVERLSDTIIVESEGTLGEEYFESHGHVPLPPYIKRADEAVDQDRYQTVYARNIGSAAAPTAGLHFTAELLEAIKAAGHRVVFVTLHVGLGTFAPVRAENIEDHTMHSERYSISSEAATAINGAKESGRPVVAVGTTVVRTLEAAARGPNGLTAAEDDTDIFITPGFDFRIVDVLFTNFHTPESTLIMLVSAFAGKTTVDHAYASAIHHRYRFFSYGDATLFLR